MGKQAIGVCLMLAVFAAPALAETLRVPKDYEHIQDAIEAASTGDTIKVSKGTYPGGLRIVGHRDLTLKASGKVILDGEDLRDLLYVGDSTGVSVSGFRFVNASDTAIAIDGCDEVTLSKCTVETCRYGVVIVACEGVVVTKCSFDDVNGVAVIFDGSGGGMLPSGCVVEKSRFNGSGTETMSLGGQGNVVSKNRIMNVLDEGIRVEGENHTIEKNRIERTMEDGIYLRTTGHLVQKNVIRYAGEDGIDSDAGDCDLISNKIQTTGNKGIRIDSNGNTVLKNKVIDPGDDGIDVTGEGNRIEKNLVKDCLDEAYRLRSGGNDIIRNKAKKCGTDVADSHPAENNYEKNSFPAPG
jgi:polygalacturonase